MNMFALNISIANWLHYPTVHRQSWS